MLSILDAIEGAGTKIVIFNLRQPEDSKDPYEFGLTGPTASIPYDIQLCASLRWESYCSPPPSPFLY